MTSENDFSWLKLVNVKGLGPKSLLHLYKVISTQNLTIQDIFELSQDDFYYFFKEFGKGKFSRIRYENFHSLDEQKLFEIYSKLIDNNVLIVPLNDKRYPELIKKRLKFESPPILYSKGYSNLLNTKSISIVGARNTDDFGLYLTRKIAHLLAESGFNIVSGYAKGVDTSAHLGALEVDGTTTAILSLGILNLSIKKDFKNFNWERNSLFISQFMPFERWKGRNAMTRNKLVTSISDAVIIISSGPEKDQKGRMSGTFDAGLSALKMNIPLFVLNPEKFASKPSGNIELINKGGIIFDNEDQLLQLIQSSKNGNNFPTSASNQFKLNL